MFGRKSQDDRIGVPPMPSHEAARARADRLAAAQPSYPTARAGDSGRPTEPPGGRPAGDANAKKLIVGRDIMFSGELRRCDTLIVEGEVEAVLADGRELEVAETGVFRGTITVDRARVAGRLEGTITVRQRLTIRSTGQIEGTVRYGEIEIEQGGVLSGTTEMIAKPATAEPKPAAEPEPSAAAAGDEPKAAPTGSAPTGSPTTETAEAAGMPTLPGLSAS